MTARSTIAAVVVLMVAAWSAVPEARAQAVFAGDPIDPSTSAAYPIMPGVSLVLPGPDGDFGTGDDVVNTSVTGDIDLVVRVGSIAPGVIPGPSGAPGGPALTTTVAGGGTSGQGAETSFSVHVSTGVGSAYGSTITNAELDGRPVAIYAFADLDGDGVIGPTNADGAGDNALELQEADAYAGRQVGQIAAGRALGSIGVHLAAPASLGGLRVSLSAGAFTGADADALYSDGTPIYTLWPFFPPLDPNRVLEGINSPSPDPTLPSELKFDLERNYLPAPAHPMLGTPFAVAVDGSEESTDQFVSVSGPAHATRFFAEASPTMFRATSRTWLRPAPEVGGVGRVLVLALSEVEIPADSGSSTKALRLMPVDLLANVADTPVGGMPVTLTTTGAVRIVSPDADADVTREAITLGSAAGIVVTVDDLGEAGLGRIDVSSASRIIDSLPVRIVTVGSDPDSDGALDDGNASEVVGDKPCNENDYPTLGCDDNCNLTANAHQIDSNLDGLGDCCDGQCVADPAGAQCGECEFIGEPPLPGSGGLSKARWRFRAGGAGKPDKLRLRAKMNPPNPGAIAPDGETFTVSLLHGGDVQYGVLLDSALTLVASKPKFLYSDPSASVGGVTKLSVSASARGLYSLVLQAEGTALLSPDPGAWEVAITSGADAFVAMTACSTKSAGLSCAQ